MEVSEIGSGVPSETFSGRQGQLDVAGPTNNTRNLELRDWNERAGQGQSITKGHNDPRLQDSESLSSHATDLSIREQNFLKVKAYDIWKVIFMLTFLVQNATHWLDSSRINTNCAGPASIDIARWSLISTSGRGHKNQL